MKTKYVPFNFEQWIDDHRHALRPPVGAKTLFEESDSFMIFVVGGPNRRRDFHYNPTEEFFYQLEGDMMLMVHEDGAIRGVPIRAGQIFLLPPHVRHSPQRPQPGSVGLVIEPKRPPGGVDGFEWFCFEGGAKVHRVEVTLQSLVRDLPPLYEAFYADEAARTCPDCGALHPGKEPPEGWVSIPPKDQG